MSSRRRTATPEAQDRGIVAGQMRVVKGCPMSALGQKQTCAVQKRMSAMGQKRTSASIDHFIRTQQECFCNLQSEHLGGGRIDDKVELGWLLDRQVCRLRTSQYFVDILGRAPKQIWEVRSVRHQSPCFDVLAEPKHCRQLRAERQSSNAPAICGEQRIGAKIEGLCSSFKRLYRGLQIIEAPNFRLDDLNP